MAVFGAILNENGQVVSEPLTDFIFCLDRPNDDGQRLKLLSRLFCALCDATAELRTFYREIVTVPNPSPLGSPHRQTYREGHQEKRIRYQRRLFDNKFLWQAVLEDDTRVIVKFTRRYNVEGHTKLAADDLAPRLYFADQSDFTASDWMMIVMEEITDLVQMESLSQADRAFVWERVGGAVRRLHSINLVFGDLRPPNILVQRKAGGELRVALVDYDWCGLQGTARFPPNLNTELAWPGGAKPGELITLRHDLEALKTYSH